MSCMAARYTEDIPAPSQKTRLAPCQFTPSREIDWHPAQASPQAGLKSTDLGTGLSDVIVASKENPSTETTSGESLWSSFWNLSSRWSDPESTSLTATSWRVCGIMPKNMDPEPPWPNRCVEENESVARRRAEDGVGVPVGGLGVGFWGSPFLGDFSKANQEEEEEREGGGGGGGGERVGEAAAG
ncbi:hypothetical protein ACFX2H_039187 [Malus domestica]